MAIGIDTDNKVRSDSFQLDQSFQDNRQDVVSGWPQRLNVVPSTLLNQEPGASQCSKLSALESLEMDAV
jgi:hypothetical protein